jgi:methyltransferase (TIGR00027 family)
MAALSHISDTAHWVAMYRALESERPDAIFHDPYARRLAGPRGEAILRAMPRARDWAWPMVVRTAVMDELLERLTAREGVRTVVNLAAGLDARPWRMRLPCEVRWVEVDLPAIQEYKRSALTGEMPRCQVEWVATDLADAEARRSLLERVGALPGPALVLSEGLLIYLTADAVSTLARELHACAPLAWWITDLGSPRLLRMLAKTMGRAVAAGGAPFRFAPAEGTAFFGPCGWREAEFRSTWTESLRLGRSMPLAGMWNALSRFYPDRLREEFRRMSGIVLLARAPSR